MLLLRQSSRLFATRAPKVGGARRLIADIQVLPTPSGTLDNEFEHIEAAIAAIASSGLTHSVHPLGTSVEGNSDDVWAAVRAAFEACLDSGATTEMMYLKLYAGEKSSAELRTSGQQCANAAAAAAAASTMSANVSLQQPSKLASDLSGIDVSAFSRLEVPSGGMDPTPTHDEPSDGTRNSTIDVTAFSRLNAKREVGGP